MFIESYEDELEAGCFRFLLFSFINWLFPFGRN